MMTIAEFCERHSACAEGREWALANCRDMGHAWETLRPDWLVWVATRPGVLNDRTLRLFAVWSARQVKHLMTDPRSIAALDVAERYAHGQATDAELAAARTAARDAARDAASAAASDAARDAASAAASAAARDAARDAASAAASAAARAAAWDVARTAARTAAWDGAPYAALAATRPGVLAAAWDGALAAARAAQADWLRKNAKPCFDGGAK